MKDAKQRNYDDDAVVLAKAADIIRREFRTELSWFLDQIDCQEGCIPKTLLRFIQMVLRGTNIQTDADNSSTKQADLTISKLIVYNSYIRQGRDRKSITAYHSQVREMLIAVYLGLLLHSQTRQKNLINKLYFLSLSISYERVLEIETATRNKICERFELEKTVCPPTLRNGLFTYGAIDNIDYNPTSQTSFNGTEISLLQNREQENEGKGRLTDYVPVKEIKQEKQLPLPTVYTQAMPAAMRRDHPDLPKDTEQLTPEDYFANTEMVESEYSWLQHSKSVLDNTNIEDVTAASNASWAVFFLQVKNQTQVIVHQ